LSVYAVDCLLQGGVVGGADVPLPDAEPLPPADGVGNEHRRLHVGRRTQAEGIAIAVLPDDLVGERLGGHEDDLALLGQIRYRQADVRRERAHQDVRFLPRDQLLRHAHRIARRAAVVARHHLELAAEHAALGVDLLERELPTLLVRLEEGREDLVAVQLSDLDVLRAGAPGEECGE